MMLRLLDGWGVREEGRIHAIAGANRQAIINGGPAHREHWELLARLNVKIQRTYNGHPKSELMINRTGYEKC